VVTIERLSIPAKSGEVVHCKIPKGMAELSKESNVIFEPSSNLPDGIEVEYCYLSNVSKVLPIFVINNSSKPVVVPRKTVIGEIEADPKLVSISSISTSVEPDVSSSSNEPSSDFDSLFNFENLSTEESSKLKELLHEFHDVFSKSNTDLGRTTVIQHKIDTQGHAPIHRRPYRVPVSQK